MLVGLTYDLRSDYLAEGYSELDVAEFDSESTIASIEQTIQQSGHKTDRIGHARSLCSRLAAGAKWDLVFNIAEGLRGRCRESQVPCILEAYAIPYTFSDPLVCALTLDKSLSKQLVQTNGVPTPKFEVLENPSQIKKVALKYPLFAKPIAEGTGKGIDHNSKIESPAQLKKVCETLLKQYSQPVLVEEFLPGREFTVAVLGNGDDAFVLGTMEIEIISDPGNGIYSYTAKEECETLVKYLPYKDGNLKKELEEISLRAYKILQCRDAARVDLRCDKDGAPCFLEINPLPGLHPTHSDLPMIATQQGWSYGRLLDTIIKNALARYK